MKKITLLFLALISVISINAVPYLKGSFNNWGGNNSLENGKTTVRLLANTTYFFKVEDNGKWYGNNGTMDSGNCTNWVFEENKNDAQIKTTITGDYVFTWNTNEHKLSVTYPTEEVQMDYYITGTSNLVGGNGWKANEIKMTKVDDSYTHTFADLSAGEYQFKITNGTWDVTFGYDNLVTNYQGVTRGSGNDDNNIILNITETNNLTITFDGSKISFNLPNMPTTTTWTIVGNSATLFGQEWDVTNSNNDLIEGENGIWTKVYTNVTLSAGEIQYKIVKNHNYSAGEYPEGYENNAKLNIPANGNYDITFTFNANDKTINAVAEPVVNDTPVALENTTIANIYTQNGMIVANEEISIFTITGQNITDLNGNLENGVYIIKSANATTKVVVK